MKKYLGLLVRIVLAAGGLTYIGLNLDWTSRLEFPVGYTWADGEVVGEAIDLEVMDETPEGYMVWRQPANQALSAGGYWVPADQVGVEEGAVRYRPSVVKMLREADLWLLLAGLALWAVILPLQVYRWWSLMRCQGMHTSPVKAFRLTMVGMFFNICMPGATGGDVMKAYYAAKGSGARTTAVISVFVDRAVGMIGLVLLGAIAGLWLWDDPRTHGTTLVVWAVIGVLFGGALLYFTRLRRWLGIDKLIRVLPGQKVLRKVDAATHAYGRSPGTVLVALGISVVVHLLITTSIAFAGFALGVEHPLGFMIATLPVVLLTQAIPLFPLGLGVADAAAIKLIVAPGLASDNQVLGLMLVQRLYLVFYALIGSLVLIRGDISLHDRPADGDEDGLDEEEQEAEDNEASERGESPAVVTGG